MAQTKAKASIFGANFLVICLCFFPEAETGQKKVAVRYLPPSFLNYFRPHSFPTLIAALLFHKIAIYTWVAGERGLQAKADKVFLPGPDTPLYDESTWWGRFKHFLDVTDMRTLFTTEAQLQNSLKLLKEYEETSVVPNGDVAALWQAKKIKDAVIHPQTGEKVPIVFRASSFVPVNITIAAGLLSPTAGTMSQVFWQWVNQSYNIAFNHANRNASNPMSNSDILKSYVAACTVSCGLALGLTEGFKRATFLSPGARTFFKMMVPFTSVAAANYSNVLLMRYNEAKFGINVTDQEGQVRGKSKAAGKTVLNQVAISRVLLPVPVMIVPPAALWLVGKTSLLKRHPRLRTPVNLALITACLFTGLPAAVALFPEEASLPVNRMEPEFQNLLDSHGMPITTLYFSKGL